MRRFVKTFLIGFAAVSLLAVLIYLLRDPLATRVAAFVLDRDKDSECTHPVIRFSSTMDRATLSPFECQLYKPGPLKSFKAESDVVLRLNGLEITHIYVARATMEQRERKTTHVESNTLGDVANLVGLRDGLVKGMLDASESFSPGGPVWEADTLIGKRDGKVESVMKGFRRTFEDGWDCQHAERMEGGGSELIAVRDFDMRVTRSRAKLSLAMHLGKPKAGEEPDMQLKMTARDLDQKTPYVSMSL
jgi:hypothetical protein